ncbi:MAG: hypothetical protein P4L91_06610 [Burkholderiaceae bacterium]|nr:hypothetical protein [Burkholderiaceae bacterium]
MKIATISDATQVLADRYLPTFQFSEKHGIAGIKAPVDVILAAIKNYDDRSDRVVNFLQATREVPSRIAAALGSKNALAERARFGLADFFQLEETGNEIALGLIGRFWKFDYGLVQIEDAGEFLNFAAPGYGKLVMVWSVVPAAGGQHQLLTETRVFCPDRQSRFLFSLYWIAIRLASGWIRTRVLAQLKSDAENAAA